MGKIAKVQEVTLSKLKPYEKNAKIHGPGQIEKLKDSINEFGFLTPCLIDEDFNLIAGHGRVMAAKELGMKSVPCVFVEGLTEAQRRAYILADNRLGELGEWDMDLVTEELKELEDMDFNIELTGFDFPETEEEVEIKEDEVPEPPEEPITKLGDLWQLGEHRLICGDSTSTDDLDKLMGEDKADLLLTDPPYNVALGMGGSVDEARKRHRRTDGLVIMNDKMEDDDFYDFLLSFYNAASTQMKDGASFYIWHADNEGLNFRRALKDAGFTLRQTLIWAKNSITLGRQDYQWKHEPCLYGWKDGAAHNWYSDRSQSTILEFKKPSRSDIHPTMKPVELFAYQIQCSTKRGDIVLDSFGGSGTTVIACEQLGRKARTCELDPRYASAIIKRWETLTGEKAVLLNG